MNRIAPKPTNTDANRRSFLYRPGGMNAHNCCNQTGQASTTPAVSATLSRSMNWSNGAVANRRHCPSGAIVARAEAGSEQYGPRSHSPRLWNPKKPLVYQKNPMIVVSTTAAAAITSLFRNSLRWSTSDMVPSGLTFARRRRGSSRLRNPGVCTQLAYRSIDTGDRHGRLPCSVHDGSGRALVGGLGLRLGSLDTLRCDRSRRLVGVRLRVGLHFLDL